MGDLLKIGQVCKIAGITPDTLRLYERKGLLQPAVVKENGYRYYRYDQLDVLEEILLMKRTGAPLRAIKELFEDENVDAFGDALRRQRSVIEDQIDHLRCAMLLVDRRLSHIEAARAMAADSSASRSFEPLGPIGEERVIYLVRLETLLAVGSDAADADGSAELEVWDVFQVGEGASWDVPPTVTHDGLLGFSFVEAGRGSLLEAELEKLADAGGATEVFIPSEVEAHGFWGTSEGLEQALGALARREGLDEGARILALNCLTMPMGAGSARRYLKVIVPNK